jgi:flagellar protein FlbD
MFLVYLKVSKKVSKKILQEVEMISITRLNNQELTINCDLVEFMEATPDTTITMTTGRKIIAKESIDDIIAKIVSYKQEIYRIK